MSEPKSKAMCSGCRDNFYNGNNPMGVKECWLYRDAEVVTRFRIGWWTQPTAPGAFKEVETLNCHNEPGQFSFEKTLPVFAVKPERLASTSEKCLWVDDQKPAPEGYAVARTYDDALRMLRETDYDELYLDYDLGECGIGRNGLTLLTTLMAEGRVPPRVECISGSPAGRELILATLRNYTAGDPQEVSTPR